MKKQLSIPEVQLKQKLLAERLSGHQGLPLAVAMVMEGIHQMLQLRQTPTTVRELVERALSCYKAVRVKAPTPEEVAKVLGH